MLSFIAHLKVLSVLQISFFHNVSTLDFLMAMAHKSTPFNFTASAAWIPSSNAVESLDFN
jgi:hypothetical protein